MLWIVGIISLVVAIIIQKDLATNFYDVAREKGYNDRKYFRICFWLGLPGWILVAALPNRSKKSDSVQNRENDNILLANNGWRCSCGRVNASYVSSCGCGKSRRDA